MTQASYPKRLMITPGHGGDDRGTTGVDGTEEAAFTLTMGRLVQAAILQVGFPEIQVAMSRDDDITPHTHATRQKIAHEFRADLVLELHANNFHEPSAHGLMTLHWPGNKMASGVGDAICASIPKSLARPMTESTPVDAHDYPRTYSLIKGYRPAVVVVEYGHLSNARDCELLNDPAIQRALTLATLCGVSAWLLG